MSRRIILPTTIFIFISFVAILNRQTVSTAVGEALVSENAVVQDFAAEITFSKQVVGTKVLQAHSAYAADLDRDGDLDIVATYFGSGEEGSGGKVLWYENDGSGNFTEKVLDPDLPGAYPSHVGDVDGDGHVDALAAGYIGDQFVWYRNNGGGSFTRFIIDTIDGPHSLVTVNMDKDNDIDLVTSSQDANTIAWYENDGSNNFTRHVIDSEAIKAKRADAADFDGDGDLDVIAASHDNSTDQAWHGEIAWHENDGSLNFTKHVIDLKPKGAYYVEPADVDDDGDVDVLAANRLANTIALYRNNGAGTFSKEVVDGNAARARSVIAADVDGDGDLDAVATSVEDDTVAWHENDGTGNFTKHPIDQSADGAYGVSAIDIDFDGDLDVLYAGRDSDEVALYMQNGEPPVTPSPTATLTPSPTATVTPGPTGTTSPTPSVTPSPTITATPDPEKDYLDFLPIVLSK